MKELCNDERPREKLLEKGSEALSNAELIAIMLRTGTGKMNAIDLGRELLRSGAWRRQRSELAGRHRTLSNKMRNIVISKD